MACTLGPAVRSRSPTPARSRGASSSRRVSTPWWWTPAACSTASARSRGNASELVLASGVGTISAFIDGGRDVAVSGAIAPTTFYGFATLEIGSGATFTAAIHSDVAAADTLIDNGTLRIAKTLTVEGALDVGHVLTGNKGSALVIDGGVANFNKGAVLSAPTVDVSGAAQVTVASNLKFAGDWDQTAGTLTVQHARSMTFTGSGSSFSGLLTDSGPGIADILFEPIASAATETLNGVTINALRVNAANTTFTRGIRWGDDHHRDRKPGFRHHEFGHHRAPGSSNILTVNGGIAGDGSVGEGQMGLVNNEAIMSQDLGTITSGIIINTGAGEDINNNAIYANSTGGVTINSPIVNNGQVIADLGTLTMNGAVSGTGSAQVSGGTVFAASTFNQAVTFTTTTGTLELAHGQAFTATITGFAQGAGTYLDLNDVGFVGARRGDILGDLHRRDAHRYRRKPRRQHRTLRRLPHVHVHFRQRWSSRDARAPHAAPRRRGAADPVPRRAARHDHSHGRAGGEIRASRDAGCRTMAGWIAKPPRAALHHRPDRRHSS